MEDKKEERNSELKELTEEAEVSFENMLSKIGFGKWQVVVFLLVIFTNASFAVHLAGPTFQNAPMTFRCFDGATEVTCKTDGEKCTSVNETYYNSQCLPVPLQTPLDNESDPLRPGQKKTSLASCPVIEYDTSLFVSTVVSQFDLVCDKAYLRPFFASCGTVGNIFGSIFGGFVGDRWGRVHAFKISSIVHAVAIGLMVLSPHYWMVLVTRFLASGAAQASLVTSWSAALECTPIKHRSVAGMVIGYPFSLFLIVNSGFAYCIRTWQYFLLAGASPALVPLISSFFTSESPRWLLQRGRVEEAKEVLRLAARMNGCQDKVNMNALASKIDEDDLEVQESSSGSPLQHLRQTFSLFWSPSIRIIALFLGINWMLHHILYVGVALNAHNFNADNPFLYGALTGAMDAAAICLMTPVTAYVGRISLLFVGFFFSGILFFLDLAIPADLDWLRWIFVMSGFLLVAGGLQVNYMYAPEAFPTEIRTRGFAYVQIFGNIGNSLAPFITDLLSLVTWWGPTVTFGCTGIVGSLTLPFLPETRNKPLPDTVQEVEERRKKKPVIV